MGRNRKMNGDRLDGMVPMDLRIAQNMPQGCMLYHASKCNADGSAMRARVTSVKTWKRDASRVQIGYKHGLYDMGKLTEDDLVDFMVDASTAESARMRAYGWIRWGYRHTVVRGSAEYSSTSGYTWKDGWYHPARHVTKIGSVKVYGMPMDACAACGADRYAHADALNPFPKLCRCGAWF